VTRPDRQKTLSEIEDEEPALVNEWDDIERIKNLRVGGEE
jgi:hypothetical protein